MTTVISEKPRIETSRNQFGQIRISPTVIADTGDFEKIRKFVADIAKLDKLVAHKIN
jgi:hypothetical protein